MRLREISALVLAVGLTAAVSSAQDARTYIVGTYYRCNEATESRADAIYKAIRSVGKRDRALAEELAAAVTHFLEKKFPGSIHAVTCGMHY